MARETKAQCEARYEREAAERQEQEQQAAEYQPRLMRTLERATATGEFTLTVRNMAFLVTDLSDGEETSLTLEYSESNWDNLHSVNWCVDSVELRQKEAQRREQLRTSALSKLSTEERDVLGL